MGRHICLSTMTIPEYIFVGTSMDVSDQSMGERLEILSRQDRWDVRSQPSSVSCRNVNNLQRSSHFSKPLEGKDERYSDVACPVSASLRTGAPSIPRRRPSSSDLTDLDDEKNAGGQHLKYKETRYHAELLPSALHGFFYFTKDDARPPSLPRRRTSVSGNANRINTQANLVKFGRGRLSLS